MLSSLVKQTTQARDRKVKQMTVNRSKVARREVNEPVALIRAETMEEILRMRRTGRSIEEIARATGRTKHEVNKYIKDALASIRAEFSESLIEVKDLELARLDELMKPFYRAAKKGDGFAMDRVLNIMARRAKYLGIESAQKLEHSGEIIKQYIGIDVSKV